MGIHDGHRERVKRRFLTEGLDGFDDHNVLELLLFYAIPQKDVNELAHTLLNRFGSLAAVFDAPEPELRQVPGIGANASTLIKLLPQISRRYMISRQMEGGALTNSAEAGAFLLPRFYGERDEVVYLVCLDAKCKILHSHRLIRGSFNSAHVSVRKIVETALVHNSAAVLLAHNHPSGVALPSEEDYRTTVRIGEALRAVGVELRDHIIVADDDFVSMAESGAFSR